MEAPRLDGVSITGKGPLHVFQGTHIESTGFFEKIRYRHGVKWVSRQFSVALASGYPEIPANPVGEDW